MCVCAYVYLRVCVCACMFTCMCTCACMDVCVYVRACACVHVYTCQSLMGLNGEEAHLDDLDPNKDVEGGGGGGGQSSKSQAACIESLTAEDKHVPFRQVRFFVWAFFCGVSVTVLYSVFDIVVSFLGGGAVTVFYSVFKVVVSNLSLYLFLSKF